LEVTFINVGYGDAILIQKRGFTMLLDGGSALAEEFEGYPHRIPAAEYLEAAGIEGIDVLVISHIHEDHVCGLERILEKIPAKEILLPFSPELFRERREVAPKEGAPKSSFLFARALNAVGQILSKAEDAGSAVRQISAGYERQLPGDMRLRVLGPKAEVCGEFEDMLREVYGLEDPTELLTRMDWRSNDTSLLVHLEGDGIGCLLAADNCPGNWSFSLPQNENVLKLPHHGQKDCFSKELFSKMPLRAVVTTASSDRRYNSANQAVYEELLKLHPRVQLLFTDEREYLPYFSNPEGSQGIKLVMDSGRITTEFIKIKTKRRKET